MLRAQPRTVKVGMVSPVTGPMAAEAMNAASGIKSMGGARIELLLADS